MLYKSITKTLICSIKYLYNLIIINVPYNLSTASEVQETKSKSPRKTGAVKWILVSWWRLHSTFRAVIFE